MIKGQIAARQRLLAFRAIVRNGVPHCGIVYDAKLVATARRRHRPFQGWRYLEAKDAPPDWKGAEGSVELPPKMVEELRSLGLL